MAVIGWMVGWVELGVVYISCDVTAVGGMGLEWNCTVVSREGKGGGAIGVRRQWMLNLKWKWTAVTKME